MSRFAILILCLSTITTTATTLEFSEDGPSGSAAGQGAVLASAIAP